MRRHRAGSAPTRARAALAAADDRTLDTAARRWTALRAEEGEPIDDELAAEIVVGVAGLAGTAVRTRGVLCCWIG